MRSALTLLLCLAVSSGVTASASSGRDTTADGLSQQSELPACANDCLNSLLPQFDCSPNTTCICTNHEFLDQTTICLGSKCTVKEILLSKRYQQTVCNNPTRDRAPLTRVTIWVLFALAMCAVAFRFVARLAILQGTGVGWDDITIALMAALVVPFLILVEIMLQLGLGKDVWMVSFSNINEVLRLFWIAEFIYVIICAGTKISILFLYLRIFPDTISTRFHAICFSLMALLFCYAVAFCVSLGVECRPISLAWEQWDGEHTGYCINTEAQVYCLASLNMVFDIIVFFLPVRRLLRLQAATTERKVIATLTFLVGLFVTVCSAVRLQYLVSWGYSKNPTYQYCAIALWSTIECTVGVTCACMPMITGPLVHFSKMRNKSVSSQSTRGRLRGGKAPRLPSDSVPPPPGAIAKTVVTSTMYDSPSRATSTEEVELDDTHLIRAGEGYQHSYLNKWNS